MPYRISKKTYDARGGLRNPDLFRVYRNGRWVYYAGAAA